MLSPSATKVTLPVRPLALMIRGDGWAALNTSGASPSARVLVKTRYGSQVDDVITQLRIQRELGGYRLWQRDSHRFCRFGVRGRNPLSQLCHMTTLGWTGIPVGGIGWLPSLNIDFA